MKNDSDSQNLEYKTEEQLKEEARAKAEFEKKAMTTRKPSSAATKKVDNFFYHYKWWLVAGIVVLVLAVFFMRDVILRTNPDITVIMVSDQPVDMSLTEQLSEALSGIVPDINSDGKCIVEIDSILLAQPEQEESQREGDTLQPSDEMRYVGAMKLAAIIAANSDPIYLMDQSGYDYFMRMDSSNDENGELYEPGEIFMVLDESQGANQEALPISATLLSEDEFVDQLAGFAFYCRQPLKNNKQSDYFQQCSEFLVLLAQ